MLPPALIQISHEAWNNTIRTEAGVPVPRTTAALLSHEITQDSGSFLWTVLLMNLIPKAGSPAAETFPRDTSDRHIYTLDAYRGSLLFHRLLGYPL